MLTGITPKPNKTKLAVKLGVSRSSLYYQPTKATQDGVEKELVKQVMAQHPAYGHKRIALHLRWGKNHVNRIMHQFDLKPARRRIQRPPEKLGDFHQTPVEYPNFYLLYPELNEVDECGIFWRADFTYLKINGRFWYQATVIEVATREVIGYALSKHHDTELVTTALQDALNKYPPPLIFHSDQGSEYRSHKQIALCEQHKILISMSNRASPWHNAHQESFFSHFKLEFGDFSRFKTIGETFAEISNMIYYYNTNRIHTALKMPPVAYREILSTRQKRQIV